MPRRRLLVPLLALLLLAGGGRLAAQQPASIWVDPPSQTVGLEEGAFEVRIMVDDVTNPDGLGGYTLVMNYDPAVVRGLTITDTGFVSSTDNPVLCPASAIDNDEGVLAHLCFTLPIIPGAGPQTSEPQALVVVRFEPVAAGSTTLDISETTIIDPAGNGLEAATSNGEVSVRGGPGGGPTPSQGTPPAGGATAAPTATGGTALPTSGNGPEGGSDARLLYISLILVGAGALVALAAVAIVRRRTRSS